MEIKQQSAPLAILSNLLIGYNCIHLTFKVHVLIFPFRFCKMKKTLRFIHRIMSYFRKKNTDSTKGTCMRKCMGQLMYRIQMDHH